MKTPTKNDTNNPSAFIKPNVCNMPSSRVSEHKREQIRRDLLLDELTQETERLGLYNASLIIAP